MSKLVVLKLSDGSFEQGFSVTLQIGDEVARPTIEMTGKLPPAPEMPLYYSHWQSSYKRLGLRSRLSAPPVQVTNVSVAEDCHNAAKMLRVRLNTWLRSEEFRPIRETWLEQLSPTEKIRVIVQTDDRQLQRFPWHLLDMMERYPRAEIAVSAPSYQQVRHLPGHNPAVNILAIIGNSAGINTQADRELLEQLPDADITFLVQPERQEVTNQLWAKPWDILFFAGHSITTDATGRIYLNDNDSLTIEQLKYALRKAVERGLKLAIFNSCDGMGLAPELADLHIPQIILMREPVPDQVAQEFLKAFLADFSQGESFYLAVRNARERLQGLEDRFPCASWLPIICQNPAELPPTWQTLLGQTPPSSSPPSPSPSPTSRRRQLTIALAISLLTTTLIAGGRSLGWLQTAELQVFDQMMQWRPPEGADPRLLVVTIDDNDIASQRQRQESLVKAGKAVSISDRSLNRLLALLETYKPKAIGLDLYRDFPPEPNQPELLSRLQRLQNLVGICKVNFTRLDPGIKPPTGVASDRVGFSDFVDDEDGVVRRQLLFMHPPSSSRCQAKYAFSFHLAYRYLQARGIEPRFTSDGNLQLGQQVFHRLQSRTGGYQDLDANGGQVLLNYRATSTIAEQVSLTTLLSGELDPAVLQEAIRDRIVLIGVTAKDSDDRWLTPYGKQPQTQMPGVLVQAQMISQILSAVLDQRPLLWVWSPWQEIVWIGSWSLLGGFLAWRFSQYTDRRLLLRLIGGFGLTIGCLVGGCFYLLIQGGWIPLVPATLGLLLTGGSVVACLNAQPTRSLPTRLDPLFRS